MTNKLVIIQRGESLPFKFDRGGASIEDWVCVIHVKQRPSDIPIIERTITADEDQAFSGFLSSTETTALTEGLWYLTGLLTNATTDEQEEIPVRFRVTKSWTTVPIPIFTPLSITNLVAWWDMSEGVTLEDGNVRQIDDLSGNGNDLIQTTPGNQPLFVSTPIPHAEFDGGTEQMFTAPFNVGDLAQPFTVVIISQFLALTLNSKMYDGLTFDHRAAFFIDSGSPVFKLFAGASSPQFTKAPDLNKHNFAIVWNGLPPLGSKGFIDGGVQQLDGVDPGSQPLDGFRLASEAFSINFANLKFFSAVIYNKELNTGELNQLGNFYSAEQAIPYTNI